MTRLNVIACIQARMGSTRLPNKALMNLAGKTPIEWIVERLKKSNEIDQIILATSNEPENDALIGEADRLGIDWVREKDETDLVSRFLNACRKFDADAFVRVTADCPLVDAGLVDNLVRTYRENPSAFDAITNTVPPTFPDGSDLDLITRAALERLNNEIPSGDVHREWMTPYLYKEDNGFRIFKFASDRPLEGYRITLDYPEDFELIRNVFEHFGECYSSLEEIIEYLDNHPEVMDLVKDRIDATLVQSSNQRSGAYQKLIDGQKSV